MESISSAFLIGKCRVNELALRQFSNFPETVHLQDWKYSLFTACGLRTAPNMEFTTKHSLFTSIYFSFYSCEKEEGKKRSDVRGLVSATICYKGSIPRTSFADLNR